MPSPEPFRRGNNEITDTSVIPVFCRANGSTLFPFDYRNIDLWPLSFVLTIDRCLLPRQRGYVFFG